MVAVNRYINYSFCTGWMLMSKPLKTQTGPPPDSRGVFVPGAQALRVGLYARVSTHDQKTLPLQLASMRDYAAKRNWAVAVEVQDVASGVTTRPQRETLIEAARRREIDCVLVWRLDRWGRSLADLVSSLQELTALDIGFVSLCEALDLTTPSGRALAGMLAVFAEFERDILRDRVKAGIDQARKDGKPHGRPLTAGKLAPEMKRLRQEGRSYREIAKRLGVSHASVIRLLRNLGQDRAN